jgi:ComF family protein
MVAVTLYCTNIPALVQLFGQFLRDFLELLYPPYCMACGKGLVKGEEWICTECLVQLPRTNYHLFPENPVFMRLAGRIPVDFACAFLFFTQGGRVQEILHALKYRNVPALAKKLGQVYGEELVRAGFNKQIDAIIPVPLHERRKKKRGYNQSEEFARGLAENLQVPVDIQSVLRVQDTATQTRKNRLFRWENVEHAFLVTNKDRVAGKRILLVDDVITTGSTLEACGKELVSNGAASISVAGIAFASR